MQRHTQVEISVGAFVIAGALALGYLAINLGGLEIGGAKRYPITARFSSVGALKVGDPVKVAGVNVGEVHAIKLVNFAAEAELNVESSLKLPEDTIASVQSAGLLGDVYVALSPGASDKDLGPGGRIQRTEPAVSLTELIAKYAFGGTVDDKADDKSDDKSDVTAVPEDKAPEGSPTGVAPASAASAKKSPFSDPLE